MIKLFLSPLFLGLLILITVKIILLLHWNRLKASEKRLTLFGCVAVMMIFIMSLPIVSRGLYLGLRGQIPVVKDKLISRDLIVVLRGSEEPARIIQGVLAFKQLKAEYLIISGYAGEESMKLPYEDDLKLIAIELGVNPDAVVCEYFSRNTAKHPQELLKLSFVDKNSRVGVVTSSWHMTRAISEFKKYFNDVIPIPAGYMIKNFDWVSAPFLPQADALKCSTIILHEYIGLIWYKIKKV